MCVVFQEGKTHGLIGRNGSGKTVLLKCICGLMYADLGKITVRDMIVGKDVDVAPDVGIIIEAPGFIPSESGYKNLKLLAGMKKRIGKERIMDVMEQVGLDPRSSKWVSKYSLGMRQRLGIAQAIMEGSDILILDEPMNGLDKQGVSDMRQLFLQLKRDNITMIISSHNMEDIDILCDSVYEMDRGKISTIRTEGVLSTPEEE